MTRKTAKIKVELLDNYLSHTCQDYGERDHEAMMMAIKALEQEPILDKVRAEIEQLRPNLRPEQMTDYDYAMVDVVTDIVAILDKYKTEGEK